MELSNAVDKLNKENFQNNLTVSFSCYNILPYLRVSVMSFLKLYPHLKENIVVFDDDSTDGTKEWLEREGIRRITWSTKYKALTDKHYATLGVKKTSMIYLVGCLMNDIMYQTKTKYLMINDGDVVFTRPFLHEYEAIVKIGYKALTCNTLHGAELYNDVRFNYYKAQLGGEYEKLLINGGEEFVRAHQFHGLFDLDFLRSMDILHDRVEMIDVAMAQSVPLPEYQIPIIDTGLDFLAQLRNKDVPNYDLNYLPWLWDAPIYHFGFKASTQKLESVGQYGGTDAKRVNLINRFNKNYIKEIVRSIDPDLVNSVT